MTVRILHIVWAVPCVFVAIVLATATGGHPPGIIFLPVALVIWALGHAGLWGATRLARRGSARRGSTGWPPVSIVVAMIAASLLSLAGFYLVVAGAVTGHGTTGAVESAVMVVVWLAHLAAVVGLLLRSAWGRFVAAACSAAWLVALLVQIVDHLVYGRPVAAVEGIAVGSIAVALTTLAFRLLFGRSERGYTETHAVSGPKGDA